MIQLTLHFTVYYTLKIISRQFFPIFLICTNFSSVKLKFSLGIESLQTYQECRWDWKTREDRIGVNIGTLHQQKQFNNVQS